MAKDGGSAFPCPDVVWESETLGQMGTQGHPGMSLRDWFAGMALAGLLSKDVAPKGTDGEKAQIPAQLAPIAYRMADAMLAEREKNDG